MSIARIPRRTGFVVGCIAAVGAILVLGLVVWSSAVGSGPEQAVQSGDGEVVLAQEDGNAANVEADDAAAMIPLEVSYDVFLARDPFESIMPETADGTSTNGNGSDPSDPDAPDSPSDPNDPDDPSVPVGKDPECRTGSEAVCDGIVLVVTATTGDTATIEVNGVEFVVTPGQTFATNFTLLSIEGDCVGILYLNGDEATTFSQCIGDSRVK